MKLKTWRFLQLAALGVALGAILLWVTQPVRAEATASFRFVVMADSRCSGSSYHLKKFLSTSRGQVINKAVLNYINAEIVKLEPKPVFVIFLGDLVLFGGEKNLQDWKNTMKTITDAGIKLYVVIGNHDLYGAKDHDELKNQTTFQAVFSEMPDNGPEGYENLVYSFEYGNSFFAVLDSFYIDPVTSTKYYGKITDKQLTWLQAQIAQTRAKHKFVFSHLPVYSVVHPAKQDQSLRKLWALLDNCTFQMFFAGHEHLYSRWTIDHGVDKAWKNGVVQIIAGTVGAPIVTESMLKVAKTKAHIHLGYNFVVVDVEGDSIHEHAYGIHKTSRGDFTISNIDNYTIYNSTVAGVSSRSPAN